MVYVMSRLPLRHSPWRQVLMAIGESSPLVVFCCLSDTDVLATSEMLMLFGIGFIVLGVRLLQSQHFYHGRKALQTTMFDVTLVSPSSTLASTSVPCLPPLGFVGETYGENTALVGTTACWPAFSSEWRNNYGVQASTCEGTKSRSFEDFQWISVGNFLIPACFDQPKRLDEVMDALFDQIRREGPPCRSVDLIPVGHPLFLGML